MEFKPRRAIVTGWLALAAIACRAAPPNPFAPLTAAEIRSAVAIFKNSGRLRGVYRFSFISLDEPPKAAVLRQGATPRRAFSIIYNRDTNRTYEGVADLASGQVASWKEVPGAQPPVGEYDSSLADRIVRADPRWREALRAHGVRDPNAVLSVAWPAGYFGLPGEDTGRIVRVTPYYGGAGQNYYAHPVEGIAAHVNLTTGKIMDFVDTDREAPVSRENAELTGPGSSSQRPAPAALQIAQPNGPGFQIEDGEIHWQKWRFRYALHPREGLVLYTVGYEDGGRVRPVMYRGALSEMVVPYGDPGPAWFFRNSFDAGELGLGVLASSLRQGVDCPQNCTLFDAVVSDEAGEPRTIARAVALYERDAGIAWKHGENTRRARELVLSFLSEAGNYEYGFDWVFHQDGALEMRVQLTGIMSVKGVADGVHDRYSHLVAKNIAAVHHQHFFSFRLDMDVDGQQNRVIEMNSAPATGAKNPYGGAFTMDESVLPTEKKAQRRINLESTRRWIVQSAAAKNALGHPTGYALLPGENAVPFLLPDGWVRKRAGFLNAHVWVTPYDAGEMHAAGDYPYQSRGGDGLAKWAAADRPIENRDVVLWYTMGITHNPRPEDWPVMPTHLAGFKLVPWGFFASNPAMDLPAPR